jgi:hypothetical protein
MDMTATTFLEARLQQVSEDVEIDKGTSRGHDIGFDRLRLAINLDLDCPWVHPSRVKTEDFARLIRQAHDAIFFLETFR